MVKRLNVPVFLLAIRTLRPEFPDHEVSRIGLHQIGNIFLCAKTPHFTKRFELYLLSASRAFRKHVVLRFPDRNYAVAVAAIAGFRAAALILVEHIILHNANLTDPFVPILW